jgi:hypothetical protein
MSNEHDDDKRPFSERIKNGSYKLTPEQEAQYEALMPKTQPQPPPFTPAPVTISPAQFEDIVEAVANRVVAKLRGEPK